MLFINVIRTTLWYDYCLLFNLISFLLYLFGGFFNHRCVQIFSLYKAHSICLWHILLCDQIISPVGSIKDPSIHPLVFSCGMFIWKSLAEQLSR